MAERKASPYFAAIFGPIPEICSRAADVVGAWRATSRSTAVVHHAEGGHAVASRASLRRSFAQEFEASFGRGIERLDRRQFSLPRFAVLRCRDAVRFGAGCAGGRFTLPRQTSQAQPEMVAGCPK